MSTFHAAIGAALTTSGLGDGDRVLLVWLLHAIAEPELQRSLDVPQGEPELAACVAAGLRIDDVVSRQGLASKVHAEGLAFGWAVTSAPVGRDDLAHAMGTTVRTVGSRLASLRAAGLLATVGARYPKWAINVALLVARNSLPTTRLEAAAATSSRPSAAPVSNFAVSIDSAGRHLTHWLPAAPLDPDRVCKQMPGDP